MRQFDFFDNVAYRLKLREGIQGRRRIFTLSEGGWRLHRRAPALDEDYVRARLADKAQYGGSATPPIDGAV